MGNLCAIFHSKFKHLITIIPSARKAQLLDYILLGWQSSTYTLRNSDKKWFMKPYAEIISDTGIPKSTLERYIKELTEEGFILRRQALYSRTNENQVFEVKKGNYIQISDKLLCLLKTTGSDETNKTETTPLFSSASGNPPGSAELRKVIDEKTPEPCVNNEGIEPLKMRGLYIRDLYTTPLNNTISLQKRLEHVDKSHAARLIQQFESIQQFVLTDIQEEVPLEVRKMILGTFFNLSFEHQKFLSSPRQAAAEYLYALMNVEFYMPAVENYAHRNNILAKLVRQGNWKTPKGFYRHCYLASEFKDSAARQTLLFQEKLERELTGIDCPSQRRKIQGRLEAALVEEKGFSPKRDKGQEISSLFAERKRVEADLQLLRQDIFHEGEYLRRLESQYDREDFATGTLIEATKNRLDNLYQRQLALEEEGEALQMKDYACCA